MLAGGPGHLANDKSLDCGECREGGSLINLT